MFYIQSKTNMVNTPVISFSFYNERILESEKSRKTKLTFNILEVLCYMWTISNSFDQKAKEVLCYIILLFIA